MTQEEYFAKHRPVPKYKFGDRVEGVYQGIPYVVQPTLTICVMKLKALWLVFIWTCP